MSTVGSTNDDPLVSVVIPCYQQAHFLAGAIESVFAQTYHHVQVIVVDDGSPDETREVVARYPRVHYVRQRNKGLSAARNAGLARCLGTYVCFLDADDRLTPVALASGVRELAAHPECAFVAGEHRLIDAQGALVQTAPRQAVTRDHYLELLKDNFIWCPATVLYRRNIFQAVEGFDTSLKAAEDYDMYLRLALAFPVRTHRETVAEYRFHSSGMSRNSARMLKFTVKVLRAQRRRVRGTPALEAACRSGIAAYQMLYGTPLIQDIAVHLRRHHWTELLPESVVALHYHPRAFAAHAYRRLCRTVRGAAR
jgi:glycosyltransferase involved in cell wall biosynthesis